MEEDLLGFLVGEQKFAQLPPVIVTLALVDVEGSPVLTHVQRRPSESLGKVSVLPTVTRSTARAGDPSYRE